MVDTIEHTKNKKIKVKKLEKTHQNNLEISKMNLGDKFTSFEDSKLNESNTLLYEISKSPKKYKRDARGKIVKVRFGVNIGSEFSGEHFAIVISKQDSMMNATLHVIPITSKKHLKNFAIGPILYNENELNLLNKKLSQIESQKEKNKIKKCINFYGKRKDIVSYACIDHLKTISKLSIMKEINEYDYLSNLKCSQELMHKIDEYIIKEYTL